MAGSGKLRTFSEPAAAKGPGRRFTYRVEIEEGVPFDPADVAATVHGTLTDPRGWQPIHKIAFERTGRAAQLRIIVASPATTDRLCKPLDTDRQFSCRINDRVVLNAQRWANGTPDYRGQLSAYRAYLVNHEVGHALGNQHATCHTPGEPAPVMMQQTKGLAGCRPNPWPGVRAL
ncbi:DUF3152 domain-containing protein [Kribbella sancticallisti]|uniref:DUF3152 domain-containing protein n=1 Tax=Kribbella sancticallisti TaxID=460087 RepID=UPI0031D14720